MREVTRLIAALAFLVVAAFATGVLAQGANPFTGKAAPAPAQTASAPPAGGFFARLGRDLIAFQRDANRAMAQGLRSVRDGGGVGGAFLVALGLAFAYGVLHALGPGHGKFVVATYFLSREARIGRGILMGAQIAAFHIVSAVVIVVLADYLLRQSFGGAPSEVPAVRYVSFGVIMLMGAVLIVQAARGALAPAHTGGHDHAHAPNDGHDHSAHDGHGHAAHDSHGHSHGLDQGVLSFAVGLIPCTGAVLVLLYALANNVVVAGLVLAGVIGLGMAITMSALGLLCVLARGFMARRLGGSSARSRWIGLAAEAIGGLAIFAFGLVLLLEA